MISPEQDKWSGTGLDGILNANILISISPEIIIITGNVCRKRDLDFFLFDSGGKGVLAEIFF